MSDDLTTLTGLLDAVWSRLDQAAKERSGPAHTVALATRAKAQGASVRMIVLRDADRPGNRLTFWTNRASGKVADLIADPRAEALIWDDRTGLQIRLGLETTVSRGSEAQWAALGPATRTNYVKTPEPGTRLARPEDFRPSPAPEMFAVITGRVLWLDVLHLGADLHRRARFPDGQMANATWIAP